MKYLWSHVIAENTLALDKYCTTYLLLTPRDAIAIAVVETSHTTKIIRFIVVHVQLSNYNNIIYHSLTVVDLKTTQKKVNTPCCYSCWPPAFFFYCVWSFPIMMATRKPSAASTIASSSSLSKRESCSKEKNSSPAQPSPAPIVSEELTMELAMLQEIFSQRISISDDKRAINISLPVEGQPDTHFATAHLEVILPACYPVVAPHLRIARCRGLCEADLGEWVLHVSFN